MQNEKLIFFVDGASKGNPGHSGVGIVMCDEDKKEIKTVKKYIGEATNNVAEYIALIIALQEAIKVNVKNITVNSDSELVVRQVRGIYKVRDSRLKNLFVIVENMKEYFNLFSINYIERNKNKKADKLASQAIKNKS